MFEMPEMPGELGRIDLGDITPHNIDVNLTLIRSTFRKHPVVGGGRA